MDSNNTPRRSSRGGRKGINWLRARTMYLAGENLTNVAKAIGVRRQNVSARAAAENWRALRDANEAETGRKIIEQAVDDNVTVLKRHDEIGSRLLQAAEKRIDEMLAEGGEVNIRELRDAASIVADAAELQRKARAIGPTEGMSSRHGQPITVTTRKLPDLATFEILVQAFDGDQEAARRAISALHDQTKTA